MSLSSGLFGARGWVEEYVGRHSVTLGCSGLCKDASSVGGMVSILDVVDLFYDVSFCLGCVLLGRGCCDVELG